jgi:exodeoxyribonuclease VIII
MSDIMLDLETMGNGPDAAIVAIGLAEFDLSTRQIGRCFYQTIDLDSAVRHGGIIDASTVLWWLKQQQRARAEIASDGYPIDAILTLVTGWLENIGERKTRRIWGNGANFDNVILASAYRRLSMPVPWDFWNDRCYRTVKNLHPTIKMDRTGTHHNAIDDAISQAEHMIQMIGEPEPVTTIDQSTVGQDHAHAG